MKVSELTGALLDYWVAKAEGIQGKIEIQQEAVKPWNTRDGRFCSIDYHEVYSPSSDWSQGGPLIERESIELIRLMNGWAVPDFVGGEVIDYFGEGETPLIAAMRAVVRAKFGDEVPDEVMA